MAKFLQMIEKWIGGGEHGVKRIQVFRWFLMIGLIGMMVMIIHSFLTEEEFKREQPSGSVVTMDVEHPPPLVEQPRQSFIPYEEQYEQRIKEILSHIVGVDQVDVLVTLESSEEIVVYQDLKNIHKVTREDDRHGGSREIDELHREEQIGFYKTAQGEGPLIIKTIQPKIRGIMIVAGGAEHPLVERLIIDSIRKGLDVAEQRISVVPRKQK